MGKLNVRYKYNAKIVNLKLNKLLTHWKNYKNILNLFYKQIIVKKFKFFPYAILNLLIPRRLIKCHYPQLIQFNYPSQ